MLILIDDGTLDTVFRCTVCLAEIRTQPEFIEGDEEDRIKEGRLIALDHECNIGDRTINRSRYGR